MFLKNKSTCNNVQCININNITLMSESNEVVPTSLHLCFMYSFISNDIERIQIRLTALVRGDFTLISTH